MDATQVIIRPVVTEKTYVLAAADKYTFRVHDDAHKTQIRQAIEAALRRQGRRGPHDVGASPSPSAAAHTSGRTRAWKKAIVQVAPGRHDPDLRRASQGLEER